MRKGLRNGRRVMNLKTRRIHYFIDKSGKNGLSGLTTSFWFLHQLTNQVILIQFDQLVVRNLVGQLCNRNFHFYYQFEFLPDLLYPIILFFHLHNLLL